MNDRVHKEEQDRSNEQKRGREKTKGMRGELGDRIILHIVKAGPMSSGDYGGKGSRITFRN